MSLHQRVKFQSPLLLVFFSTVLVVVAYLQANDFPFVSDDWNYITRNHQLAGLQPGDLWRLFVEPYNPYEFLPIRDLSYWLDMSLFGQNPSVFRMHNIVLYVLCMPLVYSITFSLWKYFRYADAEKGAWVAATVTALFAVNPAHVEAVVWVSGRKDLLAGLFSLLALWLAIRARSERGISAKYAIAALLALSTGILSKATAVMIAPVIAMLWLLFWLDIPLLSRKRRTLAWPVAILLIAAFLVSIFTVKSTIRLPFFADINLVDRALTVLGNMTRIAITPEHRHFFYPGMDDPYHVAMVVLGTIIVLFLAAVILARKRSLEGSALVVFVLLCIPYMQLIPYRTPSLVVDRFAFMAVWPAVLLIVAFSWRCRPYLRNSILVIVALAWTWQTVERPRDWIGAESMIEADIQTEPGYYMPIFQKIIGFQFKRGQFIEAREVAEEISDFDVKNSIVAMIEAKMAVQEAALSVERYPDSIKRLKEFETSLSRLSKRSTENPSTQIIWKYSRFELVDQWKFLANAFPENISINFNAGLRILHIDLDYNTAVDYLRVAVDSGDLPKSVRGNALKELGFALFYAGRLAEAEVQLRASTLEPIPDFQAHCLLAELYMQTGNRGESARYSAACRKYSS